MAETIICPLSWGRTIFSGAFSGGGGSNDFQIGYSPYIYGSENRLILKFDFSPLNSIAPSKIESIGLKMYITSLQNITTMNSVGHEILRNATNAATWSTYNGSNSWTTAGAGSAGNDYRSAQLGTRLWASIGYSTMQLAPEEFKLMWSGNHALILKPTSGWVSNEFVEFVNFDRISNLPYLEVNLRSGSSYIMVY